MTRGERDMKKSYEEYLAGFDAANRVLRSYCRAIGHEPSKIVAWAVEGKNLVISTDGRPGQYRLPLFWTDLPQRILDSHAKLEAANQRIAFRRLTLPEPQLSE